MSLPQQFASGPAGPPTQPGQSGGPAQASSPAVAPPAIGTENRAAQFASGPAAWSGDSPQPAAWSGGPSQLATEEGRHKYPSPEQHLYQPVSVPLKDRLLKPGPVALVGVACLLITAYAHLFDIFYFVGTVFLIVALVMKMKQ